MIKRQDIQVLRGLSVAAIVIFHLDLSYLPKGYLGVDVFFVISGFVVTPLITRSIEGSIKQKSLLPLFNFYLRRFLRLAPALLSTLTVFFLPLMIFSKVDDIGTISNQALFTLFGLGNVGAYLNSGNYFSSNVNPLIHTWSLGVEEQIYLFVPVALFFVYLTFRFRGSFRPTLFFLGSLSFIGSELTSFFLHLYEKLGLSFVEDFSFYSPLNRLWQFALGGVLALTIQKSGRISNYAMGG